MKLRHDQSRFQLGIFLLKIEHKNLILYFTRKNVNTYLYVPVLVRFSMVVSM